MNSTRPPAAIRGRGSHANVDHRFTRRRVEADPEALEAQALEAQALDKQATDARPPGKRAPTHAAPPAEAGPPTRVVPIRARSVLTRNQSPDVGFDRSVNPYQGCEHGCVYCFARPTHAYHDLSPGLDFETHILAKTNAVERFRAALAAPSYRCAPVALGINTDAYQPAERRLGITRGLLETCLECRHPVGLITKSALVLRDLDLLTALARRRLVRVSVSVTTLDDELKRRLEPRTAGPAARLKVIETLAGAGVPVSAMVAPVIPRINDHEIEAILAAVAERGARGASYVLLRLPHEVAPLFRDWLAVHYPERAKAVMSVIAACRGGRDYDARFHTRMRGEGPFAELIARRFHVARRRHGLDREAPALNTADFRPPRGPQGSLFD